MDRPELTPAQVRVMGCLLEKELATPDVYPLTMNGLLAACNQTSNRHPVVQYQEPTVSNALENLRAAGLVRVVHSRSNRADRYRQVLDEVLGLEAAERAVLALLMVRGPQTAAELRARTARLHPAGDEAAVEAVLAALAARPGALVVRLEKLAGQKEHRWAHLLAGLPSAEDVAAAAGAGAAGSGARGERMAELGEAVESLRADLDRLRADHDALQARLDALLD